MLVGRWAPTAFMFAYSYLPYETRLITAPSETAYRRGKVTTCVAHPWQPF